MAQNRGPGVHIDAPELAELPQNDNGENFWFSLVALPIKLVTAPLLVPIRFLIGVASAKAIDEECARRGAYVEEENPDVVEEVIGEYTKRFLRGGRR